MDEAPYEQLASQVREAIWPQLDPLEAHIEDGEHLPLETLMPILRSIGGFALLVPAQYGGWGLAIGQYLPLLAEFAKIQGGIRVLQRSLLPGVAISFAREIVLSLNARSWLATMPTDIGSWTWGERPGRFGASLSYDASAEVADTELAPPRLVSSPRESDPAPDHPKDSTRRS